MDEHSAAHGARAIPEDIALPPSDSLRRLYAELAHQARQHQDRAAADHWIHLWNLTRPVPGRRS